MEGRGKEGRERERERETEPRSLYMLSECSIIKMHRLLCQFKHTIIKYKGGTSILSRSTLECTTKNYPMCLINFSL